MTSATLNNIISLLASAAAQLLEAVLQTGETSPTSPHPAQYSPSQCELSSVERTEMRKLRRRLRGGGEGRGGESIWFEIRQGGGGDSFLLLSLCSLKIK